MDDAIKPTRPLPSPPTADPTLPASAIPAVPGYEVLGELGRGGMGVVYEARQVGLNRPAALKMVLGDARADSKEIIRFLAEAEAVAAVRHPNVVGVYEYGEYAGRPFLALEYCPGGSLADRLKANGRFAPADAAEMVRKVAEGVGAAHALGIVHRDLKPHNVLFDGDGEPKVSDFGLAKRGAGADLTRTQAVMGTPAYMSPEQAKGESKFVGPPADVWALGVILYECLTGNRPFAAGDTWALLNKVMAEEPTTVRSATREVPRDLDLICRKCLAKEPHERYTDAAALAADLGRFRDGRPILARPAGPVGRAAKWVRRHPGYAALWGGLAAALVAGAVVSGVFAVRAEDALRRATAEEANTRAALARATAEQANTRAALNAMTDDVVEKLFARQPKLGANEQEFLRKVIALYEHAARDREDSPEARALRAEGYYRVARVRVVLGDVTAAEAEYAAARDGFAALAAEAPAVPGYRSHLALARNNLGTLFAGTGRPAEAEAEFTAARDLRLALAAEVPTVPEYRGHLAGTRNNLGTLFADTGRPAEAEAEYAAARDLRLALAAEAPTVPEHRSQLALTRNALGRLFATTGRLPEAEAEYTAARGLRLALAAEAPTVPEHRSRLAVTRNNLGDLFQETNRPTEAEAEYTAARDLYQALTAEAPAVPEHRGRLALIRNNLGDLFRETGRPGKAEAEFAAARDEYVKLTAEAPTVPDYRNGLAGTLGNLAILAHDRKAFAAARQFLDEALPHHRAALRANPRHPVYRRYVRMSLGRRADVLIALGDHAAVPACVAELLSYTAAPAPDGYDAACYLARCVPLAGADAAGYADRAMAHLRQAVQAGWKDAAHMQKDPDLAPLRGRPDFRRLVADLEGKGPRREPAPPPRPATP